MGEDFTHTKVYSFDLFFLLCGAGSTQAEDHLQSTGIKKGGVRKKLQNKHVQLVGEKVVLGTEELIARWCVCV